MLKTMKTIVSKDDDDSFNDFENNQKDGHLLPNKNGTYEDAHNEDDRAECDDS